MVRIHRNVGGVPGLHVALDAFTESAERRLFESPHLHVHTFQDKTRSGNVTGPMTWPRDVFCVCNAVSDSGLFPGHVTPDYCFAITYPPGAGFKDHYDSRYRWGETVVGVTLGQGGTIYFCPGDKATKSKGPPPPLDDEQKDPDLPIRIKHYPKSGGFAVEIDLPRRSVYVMSGDARIHWKHGIRSHKPTHPPPHWNPQNLRRSLTLRSTKCYSDVALEEAVRQNPTDPRLRERLDAQAKYRPQEGHDSQASGGRLSDDRIEVLRRGARDLLARMESGELAAQARFDPSELTFPLPPEVVAPLKRALGKSQEAAVPLKHSPNKSNAFPGTGRRLGSGESTGSVAGAGAERENIQRAIALSLREEQQPRTSSSLSAAIPLAPASAVARAPSAAAGGCSEDPLVLDDDSDNDDDEIKVAAKKAKTY